jgi:hypothetical protein
LRISAELLGNGNLHRIVFAGRSVKSQLRLTLAAVGERFQN